MLATRRSRLARPKGAPVTANTSKDAVHKPSTRGQHEKIGFPLLHIPEDDEFMRKTNDLSSEASTSSESYDSYPYEHSEEEEEYSFLTRQAASKIKQRKTGVKKPSALEDDDASSRNSEATDGTASKERQDGSTGRRQQLPSTVLKYMRKNYDKGAPPAVPGNNAVDAKAASSTAKGTNGTLDVAIKAGDASKAKKVNVGAAGSTLKTIASRRAVARARGVEADAKAAEAKAETEKREADEKKVKEELSGAGMTRLRSLSKRRANAKTRRHQSVFSSSSPATTAAAEAGPTTLEGKAVKAGQETSRRQRKVKAFASRTRHDKEVLKQHQQQHEHQLEQEQQRERHQERQQKQQQKRQQKKQQKQQQDEQQRQEADASLVSRCIAGDNSANSNINVSGNRHSKTFVNFVEHLLVEMDATNPRTESPDSSLSASTLPSVPEGVYAEWKNAAASAEDNQAIVKREFIGGPDLPKPVLRRFPTPPADKGKEVEEVGEESEIRPALPPTSAKTRAVGTASMPTAKGEYSRARSREKNQRQKVEQTESGAPPGLKSFVSSYSVRHGPNEGNSQNFSYLALASKFSSSIQEAADARRRARATMSSRSRDGSATADKSVCAPSEVSF